MIFILKNLKFFRDVVTLMTGNMIAKVVSVFAYPLFLRFYTPDEMGFAAFFLGIATILSIFLTGRYELAIILPASDKEANSVVMLSLFFTSTLSIVSFLFIFIFYPHFIAVNKMNQLGNWLYGIPIAAFFISFCQIMNYLGIRFKEYQKIAIKSVSQPLLFIGFAILFGALVQVKDGLVLSRILSYLGAAIIIAWIFFDKMQIIIRNISVKGMWSSALYYRKFLFCNVPYSILGAFSKEFIIFSFVIFGYSEAAGLFALARNILFIPIHFLSSSLGEVFYKESVDTRGTSALEQLVLHLINSIIIFGVPGAIFFSLWSCEIFSFCFGEAWRDAGVYAIIFMPAAFLSLFSSWPSRLYEVYQKQHVSLTIQIIFDFLSIFLVWLFLSLGFSLINCILFYTIINCGYQMTYLFYIFKISSFDFFKLADSGGKILFLSFISFIFFYIPCISMASLAIQFITGIFFLLIYYSFIVYLNIRPKQYFKFDFLLIDRKI